MTFFKICKKKTEIFYSDNRHPPTQTAAFQGDDYTPKSYRLQDKNYALNLHTTSYFYVMLYVKTLRFGVVTTERPVYSAKPSLDAMLNHRQ